MGFGMVGQKNRKIGMIHGNSNYQDETCRHIFIIKIVSLQN